MKGRQPAFYQAFVQMHTDLVASGRGQRGHGIDHDLMVAGYCLQLAEDNWISPLVWAAALLHSIDRFFGEQTEEKIDQMLDLFLGYTEESIASVKLAVLRHDRPNSPDDSLVQVILQDADHLTNAGPLVLVRCGQFYPNLPAIELEFVGRLERAPGSTYKNPRSCKDDLLGCLDWEQDVDFGLRTQRAKEIGVPYFNFLRQFFNLTHKQFQEVGLEKYEI